MRVTSSGICGSDLHLYEVIGPYLDEGDVLGHEPMGIVEEVGADVQQIAPATAWSLSGVYGGTADSMPMMDLFDKQIQLRMGQANVRRWVDDLIPLTTDDRDPLGVEDLATHHLSLDDAPRAYEMFQRKEDGAIKVLLQP